MEITARQIEEWAGGKSAQAALPRYIRLLIHVVGNITQIMDPQSVFQQLWFQDDGLAAFGCGKRVICMDGLDLYEMLEREIRLPQVLERKVRRAANWLEVHPRPRSLSSMTGRNEVAAV